MPAGTSPYADDLALALGLADRADAITLARFRADDLRVQTKPDATPVTDADRAVEDAVRERIAIDRPDDAVLGEERGRAGPPDARRCWVLDPVDGTKNYLRGVPVWATLIALVAVPAGGDPAEGSVLVGVVSAPALGRRWWATSGGGAFNVDSPGAVPRRLAVSRVDQLADAFLSYSSLSGWAAAGLLERFVGLTEAVWRTRAFGDFWSHLLVAEGAVDASAEPEVSLWDLAPLALIVDEAGGCFTDLHGRPGPGGGSAVASNGRLHGAVLARLAAPAGVSPSRS